ncbi:zinc finger SWIM domain-containing protein 8 homolog isoform X2 [Neocloeon triangulifer]|uniref:zinc finger SWIM domain-containing protein 8 homolog isoform X2 n=1 Tax=Neocloeon triangulifer TaxID=2078957 RepID=UPI00286F4061|nr:zinc finger SWIM domain-containing protein 8 homolog isoform X2 [Neocloeon triangulifer]
MAGAAAAAAAAVDESSDPMVDWEEGESRFSFEDSDRFEEDSLCSWSSEPESVCNNWRGWKRPPNAATQGPPPNIARRSLPGPDPVVSRSDRSTSLTELAARCVASHIPFELVERVYPPVPEQLQLRIAFWSFPDNEEDIRLYSCLANGSADEFQRGDSLFKAKHVKDALQIGFHLSATVSQSGNANIAMVSSTRPEYNVAVTFDRRRITSCNCTCNSTAYWCSHVVAVCLHRIFQPQQVCLRAPVSESLSRLHREQLQKFAQYLISELPQQILPTAQRLLDMLLSPHPSPINMVRGAPDPTAGASANDQTSWYLDDKTLHDNIKKILIKFCVPAPIVFSDVNYLSTNAPPAAAEWSSLLRPLRGREPEGMWNLLSIVREMFKRNDRNAVPLLEIVTEECMMCEQIMVWWFNTKVALHNGSSSHGGKHSVNSNSHAAQHACSSLCDEIVVLWRLAALNPGLSPEERDLLLNQFKQWHIKIVDKVAKSRNSTPMRLQSGGAKSNTLKTEMEIFSGFKPAMEACYLHWDDYPIPGVTYSQGSRLYHCPFTCFRHADVHQINSSSSVLNCTSHHNPHHHAVSVKKRKGALENPGTRFATQAEGLNLNRRTFPLGHVVGIPSQEGNRSSVSSEGFCENDMLNPNESDEGSESSSSNRQGVPKVSDWSDSDSSAQTEQLKRAAAAAAEALASAVSIPAVVSTSSNEASTSAAATPTVSTPPQPAEPQPSTSKGENPPAEAVAEPQPAQDKWESSNSEQSGDEYNVYYYDPKALVSHAPSTGAEDADAAHKNIFANCKRMEDRCEILFARAEALHAHGHSREACHLGVNLAHELLVNPPNLMMELPPAPCKGKRKKINPASHQMSCLASATLAKCAFLCNVLSESHEHHHLAFKVGMFALEMARPPASTKPLEVKLANQEADIVQLLKKIPLGVHELNIIRERAEELRTGTLRSRGAALLPIMLASFIFDSLVILSRDPRWVLRFPISKLSMDGDEDMYGRSTVNDESLGFEAAVAALGLKANVSEADHPLLCEGTRRQRGELALTLLVQYKDCSDKLARIMDKLLDREVHQLMKVPLLPAYYSSNPPTTSQMHMRGRGQAAPGQPCRMPWVRQFGAVRDDSNCEQPPPQQGPSYPPPSQEMNDSQGAVMNPGSRPHSSTSAELEQNLGSLSLSPAQNQVMNQPRNKETRFKGKRAYPVIPNQPSEAGAHFMFELAKTVLTKAGGNSSTSLFTQATASQNHHGPHRALHMCAFQLGLYALGLHNCVSPNWLSRTYSSHVSWITGQAMEIGAPAISFLIDSWEGHLTPPEAASIADRASRGSDPHMVRAAAELALSCLPHAAALNPNEITRAILQCKEQSDQMLEHSCLTVESAAKGGGVYPEVLFQVARYWYELYIRHTPGGVELLLEPDVPKDALLLEQVGGLQEQQQQQSPMELMAAAQPTAVVAPAAAAQAAAPYQSLGAMPVPYHAVSYSYLPRFPTLPLQMYLTPPPAPTTFQYPAGPLHTGLQYFPAVTLAAPTARPLFLPPQAGLVAPPQQRPPPPNLVQASVIPNQNQRPVQHVRCQQVPVSQPMQPVGPPPQVQQQQQPPQQQCALNQGQYRYLMAAYRVGMLAMETLARRVHDDRPQAKYARNPPYGEDVKWLLRVAKKLGTQYLHQFCVCAVNSVVSPFILHDIAVEAAIYLSRNNPTLLMQHLRTALTPLVQKCQQMYIQCLHQKLYHLTSTDYEEFVGIVVSARMAFQITPDGSTQFKEWLQSIRRSKSCKKDLWAQINQALQNNNK